MVTGSRRLIDRYVVSDTHAVREAGVLGAVEDQIGEPVLANVPEPLELSCVDERTNDPTEPRICLCCGRDLPIKPNVVVPELDVDGISKRAWAGPPVLPT